MANLQQPSKPNEIRAAEAHSPEARTFENINTNFDRLYRYMRSSLQSLTTFLGILPLANGGLGIDASGATNGQVPIGRTSDHSLRLATLTAGTNITITNGAASISIAAAGAGVTNAQLLARLFQVGS